MGHRGFEPRSVRLRVCCNRRYTSSPKQPPQDLNLQLQSQSLACCRYTKRLWQARPGMIRDLRFWGPRCFPFTPKACRYIQVTLLRHQDIVDGYTEQEAEREHVVDPRKGITPQPLVHRAPVRDAERPSDAGDRVAAVPDQVPYIPPGPHQVNHWKIHFPHRPFKQKYRFPGQEMRHHISR